MTPGRYRRPRYQRSSSSDADPSSRRSSTSQGSPGEHASAFLQHEACPRCGSRDNLSRYDDGHAWCETPGCGYTEASDGKVRTAGTALVNEVHRALLGGAPAALPHRAIDLETCRRMDYWVGSLDDGQRVEIANYFSADSADGSRVAQKIRTSAKSFWWVGDPARAALFGQHAWSPSGKRVVVTEGEVDALSVAQVLHLEVAVVSLPNGAAGVAKAIEKSCDWLTSFEAIVLCFDQDEAGRHALQQATSVLRRSNIHVVSLPLKDANEMLVAARGEELRRAIVEALPLGTL